MSKRCYCSSTSCRAIQSRAFVSPRNGAGLTLLRWFDRQPAIKLKPPSANAPADAPAKVGAEHQTSAAPAPLICGNGSCSLMCRYGDVNVVTAGRPPAIPCFCLSYKHLNRSRLCVARGRCWALSPLLLLILLFLPHPNKHWLLIAITAFICFTC